MNVIFFFSFFFIRKRFLRWIHLSGNVFSFNLTEVIRLYLCHCSITYIFIKWWNSWKLLRMKIIKLIKSHLIYYAWMRTGFFSNFLLFFLPELQNTFKWISSLYFCNISIFDYSCWIKVWIVLIACFINSLFYFYIGKVGNDMIKSLKYNFIDGKVTNVVINFL